MRRPTGGLCPIGGRWILALAVNLALALPPAIPGEQTPFSEYQVKATWLVNFARFTEWPAGTFARNNSPILVGLLGRDPFGGELEKALKGKQVDGRSLTLRRVTTDQDLPACQILFVASSERRRLRDLPHRLKQARVLTVGESEEFLDQGGIINFKIENGTVRFEINLQSAQAAGIRLHPSLLKVATRVKGKYD